MLTLKFHNEDIIDYEVVVAGIGGMGSAALAHCASRRDKVLGVEQYAPLHQLGASSGKTRIIRRAYFEDLAYVPLLDRAYQLWHDLETATGSKVLFTNGLLTAGYQESATIDKAWRAVERHGLSAEFWTSQDIRRRYPALRPRQDEVGIFEQDGGYVIPEAATAAHMSLAVARGAEMQFGIALKQWQPQKDSIAVVLSNGRVLHCARLILTLGPWFKETLESLGVAIRVQRNVQLWFTPATGTLGPGDFPTFLLHRRDLPTYCYGFPDVGDGVKAAFHAYGPMTEPDRIDRTIDYTRDVEPVSRALEDWAPGSAGTLRDAKACMYTLTPDEDFIIDHHPEDDRIVLCGGFSGHGFKFASVVGEIAAQLALDGATEHAIDFLSLRRFGKSELPV